MLSILLIILSILLLILLLFLFYIFYRNCLNTLKNIHTIENILKNLESRTEKIEKLFTSRTSGQASEKIVENWLYFLPPKRLVKNLRLGNGIVEFALKLEDNTYVPIDSKFFHLESLEDPQKLIQKIRSRAKEIGKYLKDEKAKGIAIMVVPQSILPFITTSLFEELEKMGILIVSYEMLIPICHLIFYFFEKEHIETNSFSIFIKKLEKELFELEKHSSQMIKEIKSTETLTLKIKQILHYIQTELAHLKNKS